MSWFELACPSSAANLSWSTLTLLACLRPPSQPLRSSSAHKYRGRYHRILDLWAFRSMLESGVVHFGDFLTVLFADKEQDLLPSLVTAGNITDFFGDYDQWEVKIGLWGADFRWYSVGVLIFGQRKDCVSHPCRVTIPRFCW